MGDQQGRHDLEIILQELSKAAHPGDVSRRITLCRQALKLVIQDTQPKLWGDLQNELGNRLVQTRRGERAENLEMAIDHYHLALQVHTRETFPQQWASTQNNLAIAYSERIRGERAENLELAIDHCRQALSVRTREAFPGQWAATQNNLANAYGMRIRGERAENLEKAIDHYKQSLQVRTREDFPRDWAMTQNNLANIYRSRIRGERAENLELAIDHYQQALQVYTREDFLHYWAGTQNNLANGYLNRIRGRRTENLELAIFHYQQVLQVYTRETFPEYWAMTQNNLANAYRNRIRGERAENLELAIDHYQQALHIYTRDAFPRDWAMTQNNLANAYRDGVSSERAEDLELAIGHYQQALEVRTRVAFPQQWADTQNNLANAYSERIRGDRGENLELAIDHYQQALQVHTREAFPQQWGGTQNNLANVYSERIRGERAENLELAIEYYKQALQVYTREAFPQHWATTQNNLANAYGERIRGERAKNLELAIGHYEQALQVRTHQAFPQDWAMTQNNLADVYRERIHGERAENLEQAIQCCQQALEVYSRESFPELWAMTQNHLAATYIQGIDGNGAENLEKAIHHCHQALDVFTHESFPQRWAGTQNNLAAAYSVRDLGARAENIKLAIAHFRQALLIFQPASYPEDCQRTASQLGRLLEEIEDWKEAASVYQQVLAADEILFRAALARSGKEEQITHSEDFYRRATYAQARSGNVIAAIEILEKGRARLLREHLERNRRDLERLPELGYEELYNRYLDASQAFENLLQQTRSQDQSATKQAGLRPDIHDQLEQVQAEIQAMIEEIQVVPNFDSFMRSLIAKEIQALSETSAVVYLLTAEVGSLALLVTPQQIESLWPELDKISLYKLMGQYDVQSVGGGYLPGILEGSAAAYFWLEKSLDDLLPRLGNDLLLPVVRRLMELGFSSVVLVPTGRLSLLPLHAAQYDRNGRKVNLLDEFAVSYAPSAQALSAVRGWRSLADSDQPALAGVGNPWPQTPPIPSLPFAREELEEISTLFKDDRIHTLYGERATKAALLEAVRGADFIHLACHGSFDANNPLQSRILLAEGVPLVLEEILDQAYFDGSKLVTLSACQTGVTEFLRLPDESIGWPAGLLQASVQGVVASLWPVDDRSTSVLMSRFYRNMLGENMAPAEALREAQRWLRTVTRHELGDYYKSHIRMTAEDAYTAHEEIMGTGDPDEPLYAHPYYWAAFTFTGV